MRFVDDIINKVKAHPGMSEIHKQILITRIEKNPTHEELLAAKEVLENGRK